IQRAPASIHTNRDAVFYHYARKCVTGKLRALVTVETLRLAKMGKRFLQTVHTKTRVHAVRQTPRQHFTAVPINDCHQVHKAVRQANVGYVSAPYLIRSNNVESAQIDPYFPET